MDNSLLVAKVPLAVASPGRKISELGGNISKLSSVETVLPSANLVVVGCLNLQVSVESLYFDRSLCEDVLDQILALDVSLAAYSQY